MDFTPQDLVHYLQAATGGMPLEGPGIYLVMEEENELIENLWTGSEIADSVVIASGVRENTPALYLLNETERCVFCVDTNHVLRLYVHDPVEDEWSERSLQEPHPIAIPTSSKLSGCFVPEGQVIVYQDQFSHIHGVRIQSSGEWAPLPDIPRALSQRESPHKTFLSDDGVLHILYLHQDNLIHHLRRSPESGTLEGDITVPGTEMHDIRLSNFMAIPKMDLSFELCVLSTEGRLVRIDGAGTKTKLGNVSGGIFTASSSQECVIEMMSLIKRGVESGSRLVRRLRDAHGR